MLKMLIYDKKIVNYTRKRINMRDQLRDNNNTITKLFDYILHYGIIDCFNKHYWSKSRKLGSKTHAVSFHCAFFEFIYSKSLRSTRYILWNLIIWYQLLKLYLFLGLVRWYCLMSNSFWLYLHRFFRKINIRWSHVLDDDMQTKSK